ncbi:MAG: DMT family transporter [Ilumatobacteraceae bacterium]|nr:DMT family transporter [Actinomycetota bacterium]
MSTPSRLRSAGGHPLVGQVAMVGAVTCFALSFSVIKWPGTSGAVIAWWRLVVSALIWWVVLAVLRLRGRPLPSRETWRAVVPAALSFGVNISVLFAAVTRTSVAHSEFISSLAPLLLAPLGFVFFGERPQWRALRWGGLSFVGLVIVLAFGSGDGVATIEGDLLAVGGMFGYVGYLMFTKRARSRGVGTLDFMAILMPVAVVTATPVAALTSDSLWPASGETWVAIAILAVLTGMVAHGLLVFAQRSVPIATIGVIQVSQPAQSTFWAWVFLGESIAFAQVPGMVLVIVGLALVVSSGQRAVARSVMPTPG